MIADIFIVLGWLLVAAGLAVSIYALGWKAIQLFKRWMK